MNAHNFIFLTYLDDDGLPLSDEDGEVLWSEGKGCDNDNGTVTYIRAKKVTVLFRELRQYVINHGVGMDKCSAWRELEKLLGVDGQDCFVFADAAAKELMMVVSEVINEDGESIAYEIVTPDGKTYFYQHSQEIWVGLRIGKFPQSVNGDFERRVILRHDAAAKP